MNRSHVLSLNALFTALAICALPVASARAQGPATSGRPLSIEDALQLAGGSSEAVGIARAGVKRAQGQQRQARADYFPQLTGSAAYTRTLHSQFSRLGGSDSTAADTTTSTTCSRFAPNPNLPIGERLDSLEAAVQCSANANPFAAFSNLPFGQKNQYNLGLQFSQNLFTGGRIGAQNRVANANRRSAEVELGSQQAQLRLDVTQAYFDAVLSDRLVDIADSALAQAERTLKDTRLAREVGNAPEFELLRAQVSRDNQRPIVIQRHSQRDIAYLRLRQLLNLPYEQPLALTTPLGEADSVAAPGASAEATEVGDTSVDRRAAVRRAAETVNVQEGRLGIARAAAWPQLRLTSAFARIAYPSSGFPGWNDFVTDWSVSLGLTVPLFTGGRLSGDRMVANADVDEARLRLQQTREQASLDARTALATIEAARAGWQASAGTVEQAQRAYAIAEIRYREGISTQTELGDSRLLLQQALANRAQAARDLQVARVRIALLPDLPLASGAGALQVTTAGASTQPAAAASTGTTFR